MVEFLLSEFGISIARLTVSRLLKNLNQIYKYAERIYNKKDDELRAYFRAKIYEYKANQLIFIDKSAADERTKDRK